MSTIKRKSFWQKPEGVTGGLFMLGILAGGGFLIFKFLPALIALTSSVLGIAGILIALGVIIFMALDSKTRTLFWYMYKSVMRWITGLFVQIDPISILKNYVRDLHDNLRKMNKQIGHLRSQMHVLYEQIHNNKKEIDANLSAAHEARDDANRNRILLKTRRAGRLRDSNLKLEDLYKKMDILHKVLTKMYDNSEILAEDIKDQVDIKEKEREAIHASTSAMRSAMNVINGDKDQRALFDEALENITDDVSQKVGEMERFMEISENFMSSVDLQNGVFEEEGLKMLERWELEGQSLLLGEEKQEIVAQDTTLDLNQPIPVRADKGSGDNRYDKMFD